MSKSSEFVYKPSKPNKPLAVDDSTGDALVKWAPLLIGGIAVGIGIYAIKKLQDTDKTRDQLVSQLKSMNERMNKIDSFISTPTKNRAPSPPPVPRKVEIAVPEPPITIINGDEYEEVEVTDDEQELDQ